MVARVAKPIGRPKKLELEGGTRIQLMVPTELMNAAWRVREAKKLQTLPDAVREMIAESARARGLI
ncbi:MAG TPA: hypothetical protein VFC78_21540 [Tepidisphaeraceae bacterium]|nr:hypothetical protein [Tepidisphaeraceae bacterium]